MGSLISLRETRKLRAEVASSQNHHSPPDSETSDTISTATGVALRWLADAYRSTLSTAVVVSKTLSTLSGARLFTARSPSTTSIRPRPPDELAVRSDAEPVVPVTDYRDIVDERRKALFALGYDVTSLTIATGTSPGTLSRKTSGSRDLRT